MWSFFGVGKSGPVLERAGYEFAKQHCAQPEEDIKLKVLDVLEVVLKAFPESTVVKVESAGHQSVSGDRTLQTLTIRVEPLYGWVE